MVVNLLVKVFNFFKVLGHVIMTRISINDLLHERNILYILKLLKYMVVSLIITFRLENSYRFTKHVLKSRKSVKIIDFIFDDLHIDLNVSMLP